MPLVEIFTVILICLLALVVLRVAPAAITKLSTSLRLAARQDLPFVEKAETGATAADALVSLVLAGAEKKERLSAQKARTLASGNVVVDTLNLVHWLKRRTPLKAMGLCDIIAAIELTAPLLRKRFSGRIIFVTKDRESRMEKEMAARARALYQITACQNGVFINVVERLPGPASGVASHAALGRDDFYLIMLAWRLNCPVLSRDRFRDLVEMKTGHLDKFQVYAFSPFKNFPERDFVNPAAAEFARMRRPTTVDFTDVFPHL